MTGEITIAEHQAALEEELREMLEFYNELIIEQI